MSQSASAMAMGQQSRKSTSKFMEFAMKNWKHWAKGLLAAIIGGASNAVVLVVVDPQHFNFSDLATLARVVSGTAIVSAALYLKQSPLPKDE